MRKQAVIVSERESGQYARHPTIYRREQCHFNLPPQATRPLVVVYSSLLETQFARMTVREESSCSSGTSSSAPVPTTVDIVVAPPCYHHLAHPETVRARCYYSRCQVRPRACLHRIYGRSDSGTSIGHESRVRFVWSCPGDRDLDRRATYVAATRKRRSLAELCPCWT